MRTGEDHYKVGVATSVFKRLKALQTSSSTRIELVTAKRMHNAFETEKSIHQRFIDVRVGGGKEWFKLTDKEAIEAAVEINKHSSVDLTEIDSLKQDLEERSEALHNLVEEHIVKLQEVLSQHERTQSKIINRLETISTEYRQSGENNHTFKEKTPLIDTQKEIKPTPAKLLYDPMIERALDIFLREGKGSTSLLQRKLAIGYGRAARIIEKLEDRGVISELDGIKARVVNENMARSFLMEIKESAI